MKHCKTVNLEQQLDLHKKYDLCELIQSRYNENTGLFNLPINNYHEVTISNPKAGGVCITLDKGQSKISSLLSFKGRTLYLWDRFPIPAQTIFATSKNISTRYRDIFIEFD